LQKCEQIKNKILFLFDRNFSDEQKEEFYEIFGWEKCENLDELKKQEVEFWDWLLFEYNNLEVLKKIYNEFTDKFNETELYIIKNWIDTTRSGFFKIVELYPEKWITIVKDIHSKITYPIKDKLFPLNNDKEDFIMALKIQKLEDEYFVSGTAIPIPLLNVPSFKKHLKEKFEDFKKDNSNTSYEEFINSNSRKIITSFNFEMPDFKTIDGEKVKICIKNYNVDLNHIEDILDWFVENDKYFYTSLIDFKKTFKEAQFDCLEQRNPSDRKSKDGILAFNQVITEEGKINVNGSVNIKKDKMEIFCTSEKKFKGIVRKVEKGIGKFITLKSEKIEELSEALNREENKKITKKKV
jgi:hypothetical protein